MHLVTDVCLAFVICWAIRQLKEKKIAERIAALVLGALLLLLVMVYSGNYAVDYGVMALSFVIFLITYDILLSAFSKVYHLTLEVSEKNSDLLCDSDNEDFMKTKQGKILTVVCIILVIYMIFSSVAIYKLNAKINSVYEITQELSK